MVHDARRRSLFIVSKELYDRKISNCGYFGKFFFLDLVFLHGFKVTAGTQRYDSQVLFALEVLGHHVGVQCGIVTNNTAVYDLLLDAELIGQSLRIEVDGGGAGSTHCLTQQHVVISCVVLPEVPRVKTWLLTVEIEGVDEEFIHR